MPWCCSCRWPRTGHVTSTREPGSRAHGPLSVWLTITAGADSKAVASRHAPPEVEVAERVLEQSAQDQRAWFQQNAETLTRCDIQRVL
ncbi:DUF7224 domain-containing protein [Streptomyces sennicomposti]